MVCRATTSCSRVVVHIQCIAPLPLPTAENGTSRLFFHTPHGGTRAVVTGATPSAWGPSPVDVTACMWLRTTDQRGGLLAYSAPSQGLEFAMYTQPNAPDSDNPYVGEVARINVNCKCK